MSSRRMTSIALTGCVGEERHLARALHRDGDLALVAPARAGDAAVADLALLRDVAPELVDVLVVDLLDLVLAEVTGLALDRAGLRALAPAGAAAALVCSLVGPLCHA